MKEKEKEEFSSTSIDTEKFELSDREGIKRIIFRKLILTDAYIYILFFNFK